MKIRSAEAERSPSDESCTHKKASALVDRAQAAKDRSIVGGILGVTQRCWASDMSIALPGTC